MLEVAEERIKELEDALRKEITFRTAREIQGNQDKLIWLPVMDLIGIFHKAYQLRNNAVNNNKKHAKLMFIITNEKRVTDVEIDEEAQER